MYFGIHHVAVRVTDLQRSIGFYERHFGFGVVDRASLANGAEIAFLALPDGGAQLELIAGLSDHVNGDGLVHHIALQADDVTAAFQRLRDAGVTLLDEAVRTLESGRQLCTFRGPDGELLQVTG